QFLGVDPRGMRIAVHSLGGRDVLKGIVPERAEPENLVRCCVAGERGEALECKKITAEACRDEGGTSVGVGSCMPSPCPPPPPRPRTSRCCPPQDADDESEVECKDRTPNECAKKGGIDIGPDRCDDRACPPTPPPNRIQCCLPNDDENECKL